LSVARDGTDAIPSEQGYCRDAPGQPAHKEEHSKNNDPKCARDDPDYQVAQPSDEPAAAEPDSCAAVARYLPPRQLLSHAYILRVSGRRRRDAPTWLLERSGVWAVVADHQG